MLEFLRNLFDPLFSLLGSTLLTFHGWGAPWWLSIVMLTIAVRTLLFPLTVRQVKSMRKMQELKPELDKIRTKHKQNPKKQQEEQMKLYGERGINPLGGCLPLLVQLPIFLALYYTVKEFEALESFRTGGLFWFQDLTAADPYFILPVFYVLTMAGSQELTIRNTAPQQQKLMRFLPLVFGIFLALSGFPAGLFVYWIASNLITFGQNYLIYRRAPRQATPVQAEEAVTEGYVPSAHLAKTAARGAASSKAASGRSRSRKRKRKKSSR